MGREEESRLESEAEKLATRIGDLRSLALLRMLSSGRPGVVRQIDTWIAGVEDANRLAEDSGNSHLRVAIRAASAYAYMCAGDFDRLDRTADEVLELAGEDPAAGAGIVIGCPVAWARMCKGIVSRERGALDDAERQYEAAIKIATEQGDPETVSWTRGNLAGVMAERGAIEAAVAMARRNCELTERLGDVFSRTLALANLCYTQLAAGQPAAALDSIEKAELLYREAMGNGGEVASSRDALRAEALIGVERAEEAIEVAERAAESARANGILWALPRALLALGRARAAAGRAGAREALDEAATICRETGALSTLASIETEREILAAATS
jgi:tetratricopeptide (TPR) repeat protein